LGETQTRETPRTILTLPLFLFLLPQQHKRATKRKQIGKVALTQEQQTSSGGDYRPLTWGTAHKNNKIRQEALGKNFCPHGVTSFPLSIEVFPFPLNFFPVFGVSFPTAVVN
jgi:hypothetical protein